MPMTLIAPPTMAVHHAPTAAVPVRKWRVSFALAAATALLLWLSFFPMNWGFCAWFALVPLLALVRGRQSTRAAFVTAWLGGFLFFIAALQWTRVAHPYMYGTWLALALYCSLYVAFSVPLLRRLDRLVPMTISLPLVWVALEYLRAHLMTGFAWYFLGHTQHDFLALIQITDLGGVYAVTALVAAGYGLLFELLCRWSPFRVVARIPTFTRGYYGIAAQAAAIALLVGGTLGYGAWRLKQDAFTDGPRVAILQCSVDQATRNSRGESQNATKSMFERMQDLTKQTWAFQPRPDLIIWPETTYPLDWIEVAADTPPDIINDEFRQEVASCRELATTYARFSSSNILIGLNRAELTPGGGFRTYNSALLLRRDGEPLGCYDKIHCVPFGEYVPMRSVFPWMQVFSPYKHDYSMTCGENRTRFTLPTASGQSFRFGTIICYEDSDPLLARQYARPDGEPPVDFLVNITNDGWFDGTEEHEQHLAISRFRAIEARRSLVRSVNMGISAVIDGTGRVIALPGPTWRESKKIATAFAATVPIDARTSVYAMAGDFFPRGCAVFLGLLVIASRRRKKAGGLSSFGVETAPSPS